MPGGQSERKRCVYVEYMYVYLGGSWLGSEGEKERDGREG